jgi:hypothetical protein
MNFESCDIVPFGTGWREEGVGKEGNAIDVEDGGSRSDVCNADFVLERGSRHDCAWEL